MTGRIIGPVILALYSTSKSPTERKDWVAIGKEL